MTNYLLIDFGTTSTKSATVDLDTGHFSTLQRHPSIPPDPGIGPGRHEVAVEAIYQRFDEICRSQWSRTPSGYAGIVICSEMHGFAVIDDGGAPLTPYVSWLDARCLEHLSGATTYSRLVETLGPRFKAITGMKPRSGFPLMNLTHLALETARFTDHGYVVSLPGWLATAADRSRGADFSGPPAEHPTLLAGMGLFDVSTSRASTELADAVRSLSGFTPVLGETAASSTISGQWQGPDSAVPIFAGVGDHQCSVLGSALTPRVDANLNLGTGSQLAAIDRPVDEPDVELRPYFDGSRLTAITHIPAGRGLAEYVGFLGDVAGRDAGEFWQLLSGLGVEDWESGSLDFDLSIFEGARNFSGGGGITGVVEGSLSLDNYLSSLLRSFVEQYVEVMAVFSDTGGLEQCILSGGIARNLPNLAVLLADRCRKSGLEIEVVGAATVDESLLGLRSLALIADGRARTYLEAQTSYGREAHFA